MMETVELTLKTEDNKDDDNDEMNVENNSDGNKTDEEPSEYDGKFEPPETPSPTESYLRREWDQRMNIAIKYVCDRCNGSHQSEKCPYYSQPSKERELQRKRLKQAPIEEAKRRRNSKIYYITAFILLLSGAVSLGLLIALAFKLKPILKDDTFSVCLDDDNISAQQPTNDEFILLGIMCIILLVISLCEGAINVIITICLQNDCGDGLCMMSKITLAIFLIVYIATFVIYIRFYIFVNEMIDSQICQEVGIDNDNYNRVETIYICPLPLYILFIISGLIFGIMTALRFAKVIKIESGD